MATLKEIIWQFNTLVNNSKIHGILLLKIIAVIWLVNLINWVTGSHLNLLGNVPRSKRRLWGIIFSWLLHVNFNHLFFNSVPLFILSLMLISINYTMFLNLTMVIILLEGLMVWIFARKGNHLGASGLIAGYFSFLLLYAYKTGTFISMALGIIVLYYFGGILLSVIPNETKTSWESHLSGILAGIISFVLNNYYN